MSFKAKDLSYDAKEPAFLQKLRNQYGNNTGRLERPSIRPRKAKENAEDDEPTYVDEETNEVISREEYEALVNGSDQPDAAKDAGQDDAQAASPADAGVDGKPKAEKEAPISKQAIADIGGQKKRKQAKVVGDDNRAEETEEPARKDAGSRKPKQKKKKIKLSFDEET